MKLVIEWNLFDRRYLINPLFLNRLAAIWLHGNKLVCEPKPGRLARSVICSCTGSLVHCFVALRVTHLLYLHPSVCLCWHFVLLISGLWVSPLRKRIGYLPFFLNETGFSLGNVCLIFGASGTSHLAAAKALKEKLWDATGRSEYMDLASELLCHLWKWLRKAWVCLERAELENTH